MGVSRQHGRAYSGPGSSPSSLDRSRARFLDLWNVRIHGDVVIGEVSRDHARGARIPDGILVERHADRPDDATEELAARRLRVQDLARGVGTDDARDAQVRTA